MTPRDIAALELFILARMGTTAAGAHRGVLMGDGVEIAGLHAWQPGDRIARVDWAQSSLTGFSPLLVRDFDQDSQAAIVVMADVSASTRYGSGGTTIASAIERVMATVGLSAALVQDQFGVVTFDAELCAQTVISPAGGKGHVRHCLDTCCAPPRRRFRRAARAAPAVAACLRRPGLVVVASDFLMAGAERFIAELSRLGATHDVLVVIVDARTAVTLPDVGAGWIRVRDAETHEVRLISADAFAAAGAAIAGAQDRALALARSAGLDAVRVPAAPAPLDAALVDAIAARRLRKACA